jgi:hypothetical protein
VIDFPRPDPARALAPHPILWEPGGVRLLATSRTGGSCADAFRREPPQ